MVPAGQEVANGTAIAGDDAVEAPLVAQYLLLISRLGAAGLTVDTLVGAHHLGHLGLLHQCLEGGQIGLPEIALGQILYIKLVAVPLRSAMHGKVLGAGQQLAILLVRALQTVNHGHTHARGEVGILAVGLLTTTPTWIAEDVDVRCPERQALIALDVARTLGLLSFYAGLVADSCKYLFKQRIIERCCHADGDGEHSGVAIAAHAVQRLVPPLELGYAHSGDGGRVVHHQTYFLFECQSAQQIVGTLCCRKLRILIRQ